VQLSNLLLFATSNHHICESLGYLVEQDSVVSKLLSCSRVLSVALFRPRLLDPGRISHKLTDLVQCLFSQISDHSAEEKYGNVVEIVFVFVRVEELIVELSHASQNRKHEFKRPESQAVTVGPELIHTSDPESMNKLWVRCYRIPAGFHRKAARTL
jgi:hypothetical protein